jgi:hypothetical protein
METRQVTGDVMAGVGAARPPGLAALAVALELGQRLVQQLLLLRSRAKPIQEIALLKLAEPLEDLRSLVGFELRQFGQA